MPRFTRFSLLSGALVTAAVLVSATACSSGQAAPQAVTSNADAKFHSLLPKAIQDAGQLKVGTDATAPPFASIDTDGKTIVGFNKDLAKAVEPLLGVPIVMENVPFQQSIPSVETDRVNAYWDWTKDREESRKKVDFIDFALTGAGFLVPEGNPGKVDSFASLCGKAVAVQDGSSNVAIADGLNAEECKGNPAEVLKFDSVPSALLQIKSGRAAAVITAYGVCAYQGKQSKDYDVAGPVLKPLRAGITVASGNKELATALRSALQELMDNGTYAKIMSDWGMDALKLQKASINDEGQS